MGKDVLEKAKDIFLPKLKEIKSDIKILKEGQRGTKEHLKRMDQRIDSFHNRLDNMANLLVSLFRPEEAKK